VAAVDEGQVLLERDAALERIDQRLRGAIGGDGSLVVLEGPAGIGKTRLVMAAGRRGRELDIEVLSARGSELERMSRPPWKSDLATVLFGWSHIDGACQRGWSWWRCLMRSVSMWMASWARPR